MSFVYNVKNYRFYLLPSFTCVDLTGSASFTHGPFLQLVYLVITVATQQAAFPRISIIMLAATYGLQAIIFILKREFMLVGWMIVYLLSCVPVPGVLAF